MRNRYYFLLAFLLFTSSSFAGEITGREAQDKIHGAEKIITGTYSTIPEFIRFRKESPLPYAKFISWAHATFSLPAQYGFKLLSTESDALGMTHYRYQQTYNGYPMNGTMFIVHAKGDLVTSMNGIIFNNATTAVNISLDESSALSNALNYMNASVYRWQVAEDEQQLKLQTNNANATWYPKGVLMLEPNKGNFNLHDFRLAYRFDIYATEPLKREYVYVDASTGEITGTENRIHNGDSKGTAITAYSGTRPITTDSVSPVSFRLREKARGNGIETYNLKKGTTYNNVDFLDSDNVWNNVNANLDQYATDAHWGAEMTYDFYKNKFNRNSIDNAGLKLLNYVHYSTNYVNAFWDGDVMTFGDGNATYKPLTSLEIEGHEITHGLTQYTSNLNELLSPEAGALNEGFSDCMGIAIRYYGKQPANIDWVVGDEIGGSPFRNTANPNATQNPDTYQGTYWDFATQEVHKNSTVLSHWYNLLTMGGSGTNDKGNPYSVTKLGFDTATAICFRMNTVYLFPSCKYSDARTYAIQAAIDLYGACTNAVAQTQNAWYAVGIGNPFTPGVTSDFFALDSVNCSAPVSVAFINNSSNAGSFKWDFGDSNTSTASNPTHTYNALGIYTVTLIANGGSCGIDTLVKTQYINISNLNPCVVSLPNTGVGPLQNACSGHLYDSGGPNGPYQDNTDVSITIAPIGASKVTLTFTTFRFENGYDFLYIYNGPSITSPLIGKYTGTTLPNGGTVASTTGSITIRQTTDLGGDSTGFALSWLCTLSVVPPTANFTASAPVGCSGTIQFNDSSNNGPTAWKWDFGDGSPFSTLQNPSHTYTSSGSFTVTLKATNSNGSDSVKKTNLVTINLPTAPVASDVNTCSGNSVNLNASGSPDINWFVTPTGGTPIATGPSFTTPLLSSSTTYYVESDIYPASQYGGPINDSIGVGGIFTNGTYRNIIFDCFTPVTLVSVKVYAQGTMDRTILLKQNGATIAQATVNIPDGMSRVTLNFPIPVGTNLELGCANTTSLFRNQSGAVYPYTIPGILSMKGNNANISNYYYFFYNWEVKGTPCFSPRVPVKVNVDTVINASFTQSIQANLVSFTNSSTGTITGYAWDFGDTASLNNTSTLTNPTHAYLKSGTYQVCLSATDSAGCSNAVCESIIINVLGVTDRSLSNSVFVYPNPVDDFLKIDFSSLYAGKKCVMKLTDMLGKKVSEKIIDTVEPASQYTLDMSSFAVGSYILIVQTENENLVKKIAKQ